MVESLKKKKNPKYEERQIIAYLSINKSHAHTVYFSHSLLFDYINA